MTLIAAEPITHAGVAYEVKVERRFWPSYDRQPKWRIGFYDALTGTEVKAVNDEDAILRHAPLVEPRPRASDRLAPQARYLVHTQGCGVSGPSACEMSACVVQIFACDTASDVRLQSK